MTSQIRKEIIAIHIFLNISRSKGNQSDKDIWSVYQIWTDYNMRNIFLKNSYIKCSVETSPILFSIKSRLSISLDQQPEYLYNLFLLSVLVEH